MHLLTFILRRVKQINQLELMHKSLGITGIPGWSLVRISVANILQFFKFGKKFQKFISLSKCKQSCCSNLMVQFLFILSLKNHPKFDFGQWLEVKISNLVNSEKPNSQFSMKISWIFEVESMIYFCTRTKKSFEIM